MIKGNQKLLNLFRILIDTAIIVFSFIRAYYLRFSNDSILIRWEWIEEPVGIYGSLKDYMQILIMLIPCYLVSIIFSTCMTQNVPRAENQKFLTF